MILSILVCLLITWGLQVLVPAWWGVMAVPLVWCLFRADSGWRGFLIGLVSSGLLWLGASLYYYYTSADLIANRITAMLQINSPVLLIAITVIIAAVAGGLAGLTGGLLKGTIRPGKG